jgi:diguanylate cyclase (GGDEF)-like protein
LWWRDDHYYWLTALLATRGVQALTCRLLATATLGFGVMTVVMTASPLGPQGRNEAVALGVGAVCLVLAIQWLRRRWPSKTRSGIYAVVFSLCISVSCLIQSQPFAGLLLCIAFVAPAGYIALFHTARLTLFNALVALATTVVLAVRAGALGYPLMAVCGATLVAVLYVVVPLVCHGLMQLLDVSVPNEEIDPLTGLLNRESFYQRTSELLSARGRLDDRYLIVALVTLDNFSLLTETNGQLAGDRARVAVAQTLRETTRGDAIVAQGGTAEYLIADTFSSADATPLIERVASAIATTPPRLTASIGVVSTPLRAWANFPPHDVVDELIGIADTAMGEARLAGGNQAHYTECAGPTLDDRGLDSDELR